MIPVNIYYVRHAYSCSNIMKYQLDKKYGHHMIPDPLITQIGLENSQRLAGTLNLPHIDMLICSTLMRTMETAHHMFPRINPIYVYPYIAEIGRSPSNTPLTSLTDPQGIDHFKDFIRFLKYEKKYQDRYLPAELKEKLNRQQAEGRFIATRSDIDKFVQLLGKTMHLYIPHMREKKEINIVVVTHGGVIRRFLKPGKRGEEMGKVRNNGIYLQKYTYDANKRKLSLLPCYNSEGRCGVSTLVMDGPQIPDDINYCRAVGRCKSSIPKRHCK